MISNVEHLRRLVESLMLIAADPNQQVAVIPQFVSQADEIALIFSDCMAPVAQLHKEQTVSDEQLALLQNIDEKFISMSKGSRNLWNQSALFTDQNWRWLRQRAVDALRSFDTVSRKPVLDWLQFVR